MAKFIYPHVAITVSDIEETKMFYENIGFDLIQENISQEKQRHFLLFEGYNFQIEVFYFENQDTQKTHEDYMKIGLLHFALPTNHLQQLREKFIQKGISVGEIRTTSLGVKNFNLIDPSGITIEFFNRNESYSI